MVDLYSGKKRFSKKNQKPICSPFLGLFYPFKFRNSKNLFLVDLYGGRETYCPNFKLLSSQKKYQKPICSPVLGPFYPFQFPNFKNLSLVDLYGGRRTNCPNFKLLSSQKNVFQKSIKNQYVPTFWSLFIPLNF